MRALLLASVFSLAGVVSAQASLVSFQQYNGQIGVSTSGVGTTGTSATLTANAPVGSTVLGAYLYTSTTNTSFIGPLASATGTFNGNPVTYVPLGANASVSYLQAFRADVTSTVASVINNGVGGAYTFNLTEGNTSAQDGEALVVVYQNSTLAAATVGILDGSSSSTGDTATFNFNTPLDPSNSGFFAELRLGIGFSAGGQASTVTVNGTVITQNAGNYDDGVRANGALITVGGDNDPFSPLLPTYADDHERYNIAPYITPGSSAVRIDTLNTSQDDNIFLGVLFASGSSTVDQPTDVPEPASLALLGMGVAGIAAVRRRRAA